MKTSFLGRDKFGHLCRDFESAVTSCSDVLFSQINMCWKAKKKLYLILELDHPNYSIKKYQNCARVVLNYTEMLRHDPITPLTSK